MLLLLPIKTNSLFFLQFIHFPPEIKQQFSHTKTKFVFLNLINISEQKQMDYNKALELPITYVQNQWQTRYANACKVLIN